MRRLYFLAGMFLIGALLQAQSKTEQLSEMIDSVIVKNMSEYRIPGLAVGIVYDNGETTAKGYGVANIDTKEKVTPQTYFHTASISKLFTATAVMVLCESGKLDLDVPLTVYLPDFSMNDERYKKITTRHLLQHTSGILDIHNYHWERQHQSADALTTILNSLKTQKLENDPGTVFSYSNPGYDLLGYLIEKVSGSTFEDFISEAILKKTGMTVSSFNPYLLPTEHRATPHTKGSLSSAIKTRAVYPYTREHAPSSTLNATANDMAIWIQDVLKTYHDDKGAVISKATLHEMISQSGTQKPLGWRTGTYKKTPSLFHFGGDRGFRSYLIILPEKRIGVVLLANTDYKEDFRQDIVHPILNLLLNTL